jgi:hypothetical protein
MIKQSDIGQVFIINASNLKDLVDRRCYVCHQQVSVGDVIIRCLVYPRGTLVFHADCFKKRNRKKKEESKI